MATIFVLGRYWQLALLMLLGTVALGAGAGRAAMPASIPITALATAPATGSPAHSFPRGAVSPTATPNCGLAWNIVPSPNVGSGSNYLFDIDALSESDIWAVGDGSNIALIEHWDGLQWTVVPNPVTQTSRLTGVTAISGQDAWAVGSIVVGGVQRTLTLHWDGTQWSVVPSPNQGSGPNSLASVGAVTPNNVWAVGSFRTDPYSSRSYTLVQRWDGSQWQIIPSPNHSYSELNQLSSIGIVAANDIWAVGYWTGYALAPDGGFVYHTLVEHWNGTSWSIVDSPSPGSGTYFDDVAVVSSNDIWAVGATWPPPEQTLAEHWDGSAWNVVSSPNPGPRNRLYGVTAITADDVWTVGWTTSGQTSTPLSMHWDGSSWSVVPVPTDSPAIFTKVDALAQNDLWAVGYRTGNVTTTLVEHFSYSCGGPTATATAISTPPATATATSSATHTPTSTNTASPSRPSATATQTPTTAPTTCSIQFSDVPEGSAFYTYSRCLACRGIISGYADGTFRPGNDVTRGQLAKIVANSAGFDEEVSGWIFQDVPPGSTFYQYVQRMAARGIIGGYPCGGVGELCIAPDNRPYFRVGANATRGQISKIVSEAALFQDPPGEQIFEDVPPFNPFYLWIQRLANQGVMGGYPCGGVGEPCITGRSYFRWGNNATRGQTAKIVTNTFFPGCHTP